MLLALSLLLAQSVPAQAVPAQDPDIVVTSQAPARAAKARRYIERISLPDPDNRPLARFTDPICVGSGGLPAAAGQAVVDRVSEIAASVGLEVAAPGCAPNLLVLFVEDSRAAVRTLARKDSVGIKGQSLADVDRILEEPGHARAWVEVETRSRDGERPSRAPNDPAILNVATSTRMSSPVRRDILSATVLVDRDSVAGKDLAQVAEYAAMRALTGAKLRKSDEKGSILALFTPDGDAAAPTRLSDFDRSYLEGLYAGRGDLLPIAKRQRIVAHMIDEKR
ncbi:hypothetical protein AB2M62_06660 [Sphingomonas sp. MMS12-HWE2-04]|uniref:hypothetical protein n=1 Tax=Sphingomonas sp. MMS12-HWE2-04 TaxID=3234199 RepID=UPI00384F4B42